MRDIACFHVRASPQPLNCQHGNAMSARFEDLPGLPPYGPMPKQFSATGRGTHREGRVVRFFPESGEPWVGNFQRGSGSLELTIPHPNKKNVVVVAGGTGYVVDVVNRQAVSCFGDNIMHFLRSPDETIILGDPTHFIILDEHGSWGTSRISIDGFRNLIVDGARLLGEAFDPIDDMWLPFTVDLRSARLPVALGGSHNPLPLRCGPVNL